MIPEALHVTEPWPGGGAEGAVAVSGSAGVAVCPVRNSQSNHPAHGEGLQGLSFPSLGFYQVLKRFKKKQNKTVNV